jgi:hypothetical protein
MSLLTNLKKHTDYSIRSIEILFEEFSDEEFGLTVNGFPIWQQFYHMINSMDRIFTDPEEYAFPDFHEGQMHMLETRTDKVLSKTVLYPYFNKVKSAIGEYLDGFDEGRLFEKSNHRTIIMTKLDHILAQLRHIAWHIGYLHSCAKVEHGQTPEHILIE